MIVNVYLNLIRILDYWIDYVINYITNYLDKLDLASNFFSKLQLFPYFQFLFRTSRPYDSYQSRV